MDQIKLLFVSPPGHVGGGEGGMAKRIVKRIRVKVKPAHRGYKVTTSVSDGKSTKVKTRYVHG